MSRAKNKISKIASPLANDSDSSSEWEDNELPNHLKNLINNDAIPKRKKHFFGEQIQPIKFRPSIVQRALRKNICSSTPAKDLGQLFFTSDSSYSPIGYNDTDTEPEPKQKKYSRANLISRSNNELVKNGEDKSTHVSRLKAQKSKSNAQTSCLFGDKDKELYMKSPNTAQTRNKISDAPTNNGLFDDEDKEFYMRNPNKSQIQKNKSNITTNGCLLNDKNKTSSSMRSLNKSQGNKIELICKRLSSSKSETIKDDNCLHNSLKILDKTTKSLNCTLKENLKNSHNSRRANSSEPNNTLRKRVSAGTQTIYKLQSSQNDLGTINSEDDERNRLEDKRSSSKFRKSTDDLDKNEVVNGIRKISNHNSNVNRSVQNVTLRKNSGIVDKVSEPLLIHTIDSDSDYEHLTKETRVKKASKIPVLRSRSKSGEKCNKSTKSKKEESISHFQPCTSSNEKILKASNEVPVESEESEVNDIACVETSSFIDARHQRWVKFNDLRKKSQPPCQEENDSSSVTDNNFSNLSKLVEENHGVDVIYASLEEGSIVERFSSGHDYNVLDNINSVNTPWRFHNSGLNIALPNNVDKLPFNTDLPRRSIKKYSRALPVTHKTPTKSAMSSNNSLDEVSFGSKDSYFADPSSKNENIIKVKSTNEGISVNKWLTDIHNRLSFSKAVTPEQYSSKFQNKENEKSQTNISNQNVSNSRTLIINTDDKEVTEHNCNDLIAENEIMNLNTPTNIQNQSERTEVNKENHEQNKKSVKKMTKKSRRSLRVCLENEWNKKGSVNTKLTSLIRKDPSYSKTNEIYREKNKESESDEDNYETNKRSVKKMTKKSRKSLRVRLENDWYTGSTVNTKQTSLINKSLKKAHGVSKTNEENGESTEENDEMSKKPDEKLKPKNRRSLRVLLKKNNPKEMPEKLQTKNRIDSKANVDNCQEENYETIEENGNLNDEISTPFVERQSSPANLKNGPTLEEIKPQDDEIVHSPKKIVKKPRKTKAAKEISKPVQDESVNIVNIGRPVRNRRPPPPGMYDIIVVSNKSDFKVWNDAKKAKTNTEHSRVTRNTRTSKKTSISKTKITVKKSISKKPIVMDTLNEIVNLRSAERRDSEIRENSCNFPEGTINHSSNPEENCVVSDVYTNQSNNDCLQSNDNQENHLGNLDDIALPPKRKSIDHDSGRSTLLDEKESRKTKKSTLTTGTKTAKKDNSRKTITNKRNTKSLRMCNPSSEDEHRISETSKITNLPLESEYVEVTDSNGLSRLKFVEKNATFGEMTDGLIYSDSLDYDTHSSTIYVQIPPSQCKPMHMSKKHILNYVVLEGRGRVIVGNSIFRLQKLGRFFVPHGCFYSILNDSETENMLLVCVKNPVT